MVARLPIEYQEVEYLESTGTQWIKTDIEGRFSVSLESEVIFTSRQDSYSVGFLDGVFRIGGNGCYGNKTQIGYGSTYSLGPSNSLILSKRYKYKTIFEPGNQEVYLDDVLVNTSAFAKNADTLTGVHFGIFARLNNDSSASLFSKVKMHYLKISDDGELLGHFIPCYRKSDNKPGMYDTVSKTFYTNSGTGEFLVGNNVYYDTTNLLESRRRILLTTPHLESPTPANPLTFKSNMTTKLKEGKVYFTPVQEGTGDPSPDNVRPISGWDGITVNVNGTAITIPFPQTIYGGYVDLVNGELVEEYTAVTLDGENVKANRGGYSTTNFYGVGWVYATPRGKSVRLSSIDSYMCDRLPNGDSTSTALHLEASLTGALYYRIRVLPKSDYSNELTSQEVIDLTNDWLKTNPVTVAYPLETPIHHTIDPQVIRPFKGTNTIYSDANGNIKIKFWKH